MKKYLFTALLFLCVSPLWAQQNISIQEYSQLIKTQPGKLLDVRADWEYAGGHLPGALQLDMFKPDFSSKLSQLDKNQTYYVYCYSGGRSREAAQQMLKMGFKSVYNIRDGVPVMQRAGMSLKQGMEP